MKKSIALITSHAQSLVNFRSLLIHSLHAQGLQVFALAPNFDERTRTAMQALGAMPVDCPMERTGMNPLRDAINTWRMTRLLQHLQPDVTLSYFIKPVIFGTLAAWLAGVPHRFAMVEGLGFVFTPTGDVLPVKRRLLKRLVLWLYKLGISRAKQVIFLNPDDLSELEAAGALPPGKGFLLGGIGVDLAHWVPTPPVLQPPTFMLVARLLREKGVEQYAAAARIVKQKYPQARFILLGGLDDNPGAITETDVQAWVTEGILEWHGHTPVQPWMAQTSVFVLPSFREGVPVSTQEAMAMSRAVITTDVPGCRQTVIDGVNGFLVPPHDVQALAEKMQLFIEQPDLIATMGQASRRLAEERFDVHEVNDRLMHLLLDK
ncbi:N,N'-diacetylbacillosaminyl-diphospho-undecaprenol alpha-1,3-N-acetylgalactosaminyltransferase [uncultured Comamonas sp.]|nr:N,N'-diacetylbacillosaminyl-diphospho-undecaprenol alpha-1,3-N-acetylgalactosaminyltransferase [uncultured Comamonas sp.]